MTQADARGRRLRGGRRGQQFTPDAGEFRRPVYQVLPILDPAGGVVLAVTLEGGVSPIDEDQDGWHDVTVVPLPDGRVIIAGGRDDGKVYRWDAATGEPLPALTGHRNIVMAVTTATTADGTPMIVSVSEAGDVRRWHAETGEPIGTPLPHRADLFTRLLTRIDDQAS